MNRIQRLMLLACCTAMTSPAFAQDQVQEEERQYGTDSLGDIVVTARKKARAEQLQDVPIAATAFGPIQLENSFSRNIIDIGQQAPSVRLLTVGAVPSVANFTIRGMGVNSSIASDEPTVGITVDGVYLASNVGAIVDNFDLEAIEILRGPQGTLFGRNVTAGAVVIRTRRPTGDFGLDIVANVGSGGRKDISVAVEDAITPTLSGRLSASYRSLDGFFKNAARPGKPIDHRDDFDLRPTLVWKPDTQTSMTLIGQYSRNRDGGVINKLLVTPDFGLQRTGYVPPKGKFVLDQNFPGFSNLDIRSLTLEINRDIGNGTLTSVTGYRDVKLEANLDTDATSIDSFRQFVDFKQHQISEELRYAGTSADGNLDYTVGLYAMQQAFVSQSMLYLVQTPLSTLIADGRIEEKSIGLFGQVEWRLADKIALIGGLRANYDKKDADLGYGLRTPASTLGSCDPAALPEFVCTRDFHGKKSWKDISPKLGVTWQPDTDTTIFASATRGFRSGGFNVRNFNVRANPGPYNPERVDALEVGIKRDNLDGRLRTNLTAYYNKYHDLQRTVVDTNATSTILNAASARIWGIELETAVIPVRGIRIDGTVGYINAAYSRFSGLDLTGDGIADPDLAKNLKPERAPKWTWSLAGTWTVFDTDAGSLSANANYSYTSATPVDTANTGTLGSYGLFDASLRFTTADKRMTVSLYGKNLTNELYTVTGFTVNAIGRGRYYSPPRSYGVETRFSF